MSTVWRQPLLVGGARVAGAGAPIETVNPSTGLPLAVVHGADEADVDRAVAAARGAVRGEWGRMAPADRGRVLAEAARTIAAHADELAALDVADAGVPVRMARADVATAARYFEYYAGSADKVHGESIPLGPGFLDFTLRQPYGVCAVVIPFNIPLQLFSRSVAPALATGNAVVVKVAEQSPLPALRLGELLVPLLPDGTLSVLAGTGATTGAMLTGHPDVDHVTFTGSLATGQRVMHAAADAMTAVTLELGGKSPQIVFADADVEQAVRAIAASAFSTAGQVCSAGTRVLVEESAYDQLAAAIAERADAIAIGPAAEDPEMGPVVSATQRDSILGSVEAARHDGARVVAGGGIPSRVRDSGGFFVEPTVVADIDPGAAICQEETFGPVVTLLPFADADEALELANGTEFGLVAGIWTRDVARAMALAGEVRAGQVYVNSVGVGGGVELPFGGFGRSGIGREKGLAALLEYTQVKNVCVQAELR